MKKIAIILNGLSGVTAPLKEIQQLSERVDSSKFTFSVRVIGAPDNLDDIVENLIEEKFTTIIGAGGDGTLNSIASYLIDTKIKFGILPVGTLNHLAKDLRIPLDLKEAFELIIGEHEIIKIDTGECNGKLFLNNSGLGIYPRIVELREDLVKDGHIKKHAHLYALFRVLKKIPRFYASIKIHGDTISKKTSFVFVGNNAYGLGGLTTGTRDSLCDGKLSLWISHRTSLWGILILVVHALFGNIKEHRDFDVFEAEELIVSTKKKKMVVSLDGEIQEIKSPLKYKIIPRSLNVIVPINI